MEHLLPTFKSYYCFFYSKYPGFPYFMYFHILFDDLYALSLLLLEKVAFDPIW